MKYSISNKTLPELVTDCLVLAVNPDALPTSLPAETAAQIEQRHRDGDLTNDKFSSVLLYDPAGLSAKRLLVIHTGSDALSQAGIITLIEKVAAGVTASGAKSAAISLDDIPRKAEISRTWLIREVSHHLGVQHYRFNTYKSKPLKQTLSKWQLLTDDNSHALKQALKEGQAIAIGQNFTRDLGNTPPNVCHPEWLAEQAKDMAKQYSKLKVSVLTEKEAEKLGMEAFKAVSRGSSRDGRIILFDYKGDTGAPIALVGKGVTFDTGGISLKPGANMDEMKYDMCGAASVFGAIKTACELDLTLHLVGVVAAAENMPDGDAMRPGDIVTTLSGQTVEILNTDAEGRLVLCDALTYAQQKFKPRTLINMATLTGACVIALGHQAQAIYANDDSLSAELLAAGEDTCDRGWPMPLWDEYQDQLKSNFADFAHIGGRPAGSITAACYLSRFTKDVRWAHLDIAGTAWHSGSKKGATGRPVPLLTRYLIEQSND